MVVWSEAKNLVCYILNLDFRNVKKRHGVGTGEELAKSVTFLLYSLY